MAASWRSTGSTWTSRRARDGTGVPAVGGGTFCGVEAQAVSSRMAAPSRTALRSHAIGLASVAQAFGQAGWQLDLTHQPLSGVDVVAYAPEFGRGRVHVQEQVGRRRIAVARLPHAAGIDQGAAGLDSDRRAGGSRHHAHAALVGVEDDWHVGVAVQAEPRVEGRQVGRGDARAGDVLPGRVARRAMHRGELRAAAELNQLTSTVPIAAPSWLPITLRAPISCSARITSLGCGPWPTMSPSS